MLFSGREVGYTEKVNIRRIDCPTKKGAATKANLRKRGYVQVASLQDLDVFQTSDLLYLSTRSGFAPEFVEPVHDDSNLAILRCGGARLGDRS